MSDPTKRFSTRVGHYVRSRPSYPAALLDFFRDTLSLKPSHRIADVGSGTGILSQLFLKNGNAVFGVEPNAEMRSAGEEFLRHDSKFHSVDGTAEATTLPSASVHFVTAAQAFHWFDPLRAAAEFRRILAPGGWTALVWNERRAITTGFNAAYDRFISDFTSDRKTAAIRGGSVGATDSIIAFFGKPGFKEVALDNHQDLTWDGLLDRVYSSSYMPLPDDPRTPEMIESLQNIFDAYSRDGIIRIEYETRVFYGNT